MSHRPFLTALAALAVAGPLAAAVEFTPEQAPEIPVLTAADPATFFSGWTGGVEVGLNGSSGNSDVLNFRGAVSGERKTELMVSKGSIAYSLARADSQTTKSRLEAGVRNDWIFAKDSPWRYYLIGSFEFDDFQDWKERVIISNGIGYSFIHSERTSLIGRLGVGVEKEFGGSDNRLHPEGDIGVDLEHKLTDRQKLSFSADYYPDFLDLTNYRATGKAAWEILVDPEVKMSLKVGVEDRYDPTPNGKKRNDIDYFALLVWSF